MLFEFLFALGTAICFGIGDVVSKKAIHTTSLYKAITYSYILMVSLLIIGAIISGVKISLPHNTMAYLVEIMIGAIAVLALFKAFEEGKASILAPVSKLNVLIIISIGIVVLGETLTLFQLIGSLIMIASALVLSITDLRNFKLEKGVFYLLITILGWGYFYSFYKTFVAELGPYPATLILEAGVGLLVILYCMARKKDLKCPTFDEGKYIGARSLSLFIGSLLYSYSVNSLGAGLTAAIVAGSPIITAILSYELLNEKLDRYKYAGILLMVAGLVLIFLMG